jgi:hypothetical protein
LRSHSQPSRPRNGGADLLAGYCHQGLTTIIHSYFAIAISKRKR